MFYYIFVTFPRGILGQVLYLIVLIPDLCHLSYFQTVNVLFRRPTLIEHGLYQHSVIIDNNNMWVRVLSGHHCRRENIVPAPAGHRTQVTGSTVKTLFHLAVKASFYHKPVKVYLYSSRPCYIMKSGK